MQVQQIPQNFDVGLISMMQEMPNPDRQYLINECNLAEFIGTEIYPSNFEPGCSEYKLGRVHKEEWSVIIRKHKQILITAPRDHLKSFFFTESYAIQQMKYKPGIRIIIISETDGQAKKRLKNIKKIIESSESLRWLKPGNPDNWSKKEITCTNGSSIEVAGFFSGMRGGHIHYMLLDDCISEKVIYSPDQNQKYIERFLQTILPMAESDTKIVVVGTRQMEGDLYDTLKPPEWAVYQYKAVISEERKETLFPEKWPWAALMERKNTIVNNPKGGLRIWLKEYENDVRAMKGNVVKYENFRFWKLPGEQKPITGRWINNIWTDLPQNLDIYQGWDLAPGRKPTNDYTCCITAGIDRKTGDIYILDVLKARMSMPERIQSMKDKGLGFQPRVLQIGIENNAFQDDTVQAAIKASNLPIIGVHSTSNKHLRLESVCTVFVNGKVYVTPLMDDFIEEVVSFPTGAHDDQLDAFDIMLMMSRMRRQTHVINMNAAAQTDPELKQLALTGKLPNNEYKDILTQTGDREFIIKGFAVKLDHYDTICRGPVYLLGKTIQQAIETIIIRERGVVQTNRDVDGLMPSQRSPYYDKVH